MKISVGANAHTIVAENVPNLLTLQGGLVFREVLSELESAGYEHISWRMLNARMFGLPHQRRRVFIVASQHPEAVRSIHREIARSDNCQQGAVSDAGADGSRVLVVPTDVRDPASVASLFAITMEAFGRLDLLFNNAGIGAPAVLLEDLTPEQWRTVVDINLTGSFLCTQEAFKLMKSQEPRGGRIINNASISAHVPRPNSAPYTATKHAITGLTKSTALDGRKYDIACGQIDIGNATTEMTQRMTGAGVPQANGSVEVEPRMDADHVARAVVHMANLPLDANVLTMTIMATKMPYVGRG